MTGKQVRLFLVDGSTGSLLTVEIMNWTGHLIAAPRSELAQLLNRAEVKGTGVYLLLGDDPDGAYDTRVYVGEGDSVDTRLRAHARPQEAGGKDFWNRVVVITSKDANITKAHARYLESRLIAIASRVKRAALENATSPPGQALPEADRSDMEYFIAQLQIVLPVLGIPILRETRVKQVPTAVPQNTGPDTSGVNSSFDKQGDMSATTVVGAAQSPEFRLRVAKDPDRYALAVEIDAEFVVLADSYASSSIKNGMQSGYESKRHSLEQSGVLRAVDGEPTVLRVVQDVAFRSVSKAASVINGSSENGRKRWVTKDGLTYGAWQSFETLISPADP